MAILKKGSRKITVDDTEYRWLIKRKYKSADDNLTVVIEKIENGKTILYVNTGFLRPDGGFLNMRNLIQRIVTPKNIREYIKQALAQGWEPELNGNMFILSMENR